MAAAAAAVTGCDDGGGGEDTIEDDGGTGSSRMLLEDTSRGSTVGGGSRDIFSRDSFSSWRKRPTKPITRVTRSYKDKRVFNRVISKTAYHSAKRIGGR